MRVGIFSTFAEPAALDLVKSILHATETKEIPDTEVAFIFSNRGFGENPQTDSILGSLEKKRTPLITFSAKRFKPAMRSQAKRLRQLGDPSLMTEWRDEFANEVLDRIPETDIDLLLGDWTIWGGPLCQERNGINLHPALPNGPKGEWYNVIWELIKDRARETGVMMHKVTEELDRGPAVTYCRFPITGGHFDHLWRGLPADSEGLDNVVKHGLMEKEKASDPLHREIRRHGLAREMVLIVQTTKAFAEGNVKMHGELVFDRFGSSLDGGYDLTDKIDEKVRPQLEGQLTVRKEVR